MIAARIALGVAGLGLAGFGVVTLAQTLALASLIWVGVWLAGAVVVHDGVLVPAVSLLRARLRRRGRRWPRAATAVIELGAMVTGVLVLFVVPELIAQARGNPNPTILQGDYALRLLVAVLLIAAAALVVVRVLVRRARRRDADQDAGR
ncbi:hypothetical protein [Microbacterium luticocti]|uniref:hypothetical protein n=1 Tax=Microbacterium luticocti TaxID=451764 RepID=UPI0004262C24|nr:hypothetical protein [Microbacterium luticocti]